MCPNQFSSTAPPPELQMLLARHGADPRALVQLLRELQTAHGWLPRESLSALAAALGLTLAQVRCVAGFYRFFYTQPVGDYRILYAFNDAEVWVLVVRVAHRGEAHRGPGAGARFV